MRLPTSAQGPSGAPPHSARSSQVAPSLTDPVECVNDAGPPSARAAQLVVFSLELLFGERRFLFGRVPVRATMRGVITKVQVLAHPVVIIESFGVKVLVRALFADARETFLEIVSRCDEEKAHRGMEEIDLARTVKRFVGFERRLGEVYRRLSQQFSGEVGRFFMTLAGHEEGHAIVLSRVRREIRKGRLWKHSKDLHFATEELEARLEACEEEARRGVALARALEIVEGIEGSEINVVFDTLSGSVDMRSRARFEQFFVLSQRHLAYCDSHIQALRAQRGIARTQGP